jgi:hypothetical protein
MTEREPTKRKENDLCIGEKKDECVCGGDLDIIERS